MIFFESISCTEPYVALDMYVVVSVSIIQIQTLLKCEIALPVNHVPAHLPLMTCFSSYFLASSLQLTFPVHAPSTGSGYNPAPRKPRGRQEFLVDVVDPATNANHHQSSHVTVRHRSRSTVAALPIRSKLKQRPGLSKPLWIKYTMALCNPAGVGPSAFA